MTVTTCNANPTNLTKLKSLIILYPGPQYEVAGLTGIDPTTLSFYARGQKPIPAHHLQRLCDFFQCTVNDLIGNLDADDPFWSRNG